MELRLPTPEQLRTVYGRDLKEAFPAAELKPLRNIEKSWAEGWYKPYCLFDGDNIVGEAFLWLGHPGWALLDYLCVSASCRNGGLGAVILQKLREREGDTVIFGESEAPAAVKRDSRVVGGPDLQGQKCQVVGLGKIQEHLQKFAGHPLLPAVRPDGHIGDIPLVQHRLQAGVARHLIMVIQSHQESGKVII